MLAKARSISRLMRNCSALIFYCCDSAFQAVLSGARSGNRGADYGSFLCLNHTRLQIYQDQLKIREDSEKSDRAVQRVRVKQPKRP
jgi:hypothetical protein